MIKKLLLVSISLMYHSTYAMEQQSFFERRDSFERLPEGAAVVRRLNSSNEFPRKTFKTININNKNGLAVEEQTDECDGVSAIFISRRHSIAGLECSNEIFSSDSLPLNPEELTSALKQLKENRNIMILQAKKKMQNGKPVILINLQINLEELTIDE